VSGLWKGLPIHKNNLDASRVRFAAARIYNRRPIGDRDIVVIASGADCDGGIA
jgi:hypothetical protein